MSRIFTLLFLVSIFFVNQAVSQVQSSGACAGGCNWSNGATWVPNTPGGPSAGTPITIVAGDVINLDVNVAIDQTVIQSGATLNLNAGQILTINDGTGTDLDNSGSIVLLDLIGIILSTLNVDGYVINSGSISTTLSTINVGSTGIIEHAQNAGAIPTANWDADSELIISGLTDTAPTGLNQNFGNFTFNSALTSPLVDLGITSPFDIQNDFIITGTGGNFLALKISGDISFAANNFTVSGSSNVVIGGSGNTVTMFVANNVTNTGLINFAGTGATGNIYVAGDFAHTSGSMLASGTGNIFFNGLSNFTDGGTFTNIDFTVLNTKRVTLTGESAFSGSGDFTLDAGGTLALESVDGLSQSTSDGAVQVSGTRTYNAAGNIIYTGTSTQDLGDEWASGGDLNGVAVNLEINKSAGQVNNNNTGTTSLLGNLTLSDGEFSIGTSNTLDVSNDLTITDGTLIGSTTSNLTFSGSGNISGNLTFTTDQTLQDLTIDRAGTIVLGSNLTISNTGTLFFPITGGGSLDFSSQILTINGDMVKDGAGGIISTDDIMIDTDDSELIIAGSGSLSSIPFSAASSITTLRLSRTGGASYNWASSLLVHDLIELSNGTLNHTSGLQPSTDCIFARDQGSSFTGVILAGSSVYDILYNGTITTSEEIPPSSSPRLGNLEINGDVTLDKNINVTNELVLTSGSLSFGGFFVEMDGNITNNGGSLNQGASTLFFTGNTTIGGSNPTTLGNIEVSNTLILPNGTVGFSGNIVNNGTLTASSSTASFSGTTSISGSSETSLNNVAFTGAGTLNAPTGNLNIAGNWDSSLGTLNASSGTIIFNGSNQTIRSGSNAFNDLNLAGTNTKTLQDPLDVNGILTISSTLDVGAGDYLVNVAGNWVNDGTFTAGDGTVELDGSNVQNIQGSSTTTFHDLNISNTSTFGVRVETNQNLEGVLTVTDASSVFDADGTSNTSVFTLLSSADNPAEDAAIASLPTPSNFTGNVTVQRYMSGEGRIWRYISSPVTGQTVADWQTQFPITGSFTGADDLGGANNASLYLYNESLGGAIDDRWVEYPMAINTEAIDNGVGYVTFIREEVAPTIISQRGPIGKDDVVYTISQTGSDSDDGWNLLGNPYPAPLDWEDLYANGTNIDATVYTRDNGGGGGVFATWHATLQSGTNGGTKNIATGQSFWVKANNSGPTLTAQESMKATDGTTVRFFDTPVKENLLRITLAKDDLRDEVIQYFDPAGEEGVDELDALKLNNGVHDLSIKSSTGDLMTINTISDLDCSAEIFLNIELPDATITEIEGGGDGTYKLEFTGLNSFPINTSLILMDHFSNQSFTVTETSEFEFEVSGDPESYGDERFSILFTEYEIETAIELSGNQICNDIENSVIQLSSSESGVEYLAYFGEEEISSPVVGTGEEIELEINTVNLSVGDNDIVIKARFSECATVPLASPAIVTKYDKPGIEVESFSSNCDLVGTLVLGELNEGSLYKVFKTLEDEVPIIESTLSSIEISDLDYGSNEYFISLVEANGCTSELTSVSVTVDQLETPVVEEFTTECDNTALLVLESQKDGSVFRIYRNADDTEPLLVSSERTIEFTDLSDGINTYYISVSNASECEGEKIQSSIEIFGSDPLLTLVDDELAASIDGADAYQWFLDDLPIDGETNQILSIDGLNGNISVEVTIGSCTKSSPAELVTGVEDDLAKFGFAIYPNPVQDNLYIKISKSGEEYGFKIFDLNGRLELKGEISDKNKTIDVSNLSRGSYIFMVISEQSTIFSSRFIKE